MAHAYKSADFVFFPTPMAPPLGPIRRARNVNKNIFAHSVPPVGQFMYQTKLLFTLPIGSYVELNHDFHNCYLDPQGSDIEDGRLTFLIVLALQRANPEQKKLLNANYGCCEPEKVEIIKQVRIE